MSRVSISLAIESAHLEIPIADIEQIALELGCRLTREPRELTLHGDDEGAALVFDCIGPLAMLRDVVVSEDENGLFAVHVFGRLLSAYEGDLEARVETVPAEVYPPSLSVRRGETVHPLFAAVMPAMAPQLTAEKLAYVEGLIDEARTAFAEWLRTKQGASTESA